MQNKSSFIPFVPPEGKSHGGSIGKPIAITSVDQVKKATNIILQTQANFTLDKNISNLQKPISIEGQGLLRAPGAVNLKKNIEQFGSLLLTSKSQPSGRNLHSLSPTNQLREGLFLYSKIIRAQINHPDLENILKTFTILTCDQKVRGKQLQDLKKPEKRAQLIKMRSLQNFTTDNKTEAQYFFYLIITELMANNQYLGFEGALFLVNRYLLINKDLQIGEQQQLNLNLVLKECNVKILNELSSGSIKNQVFFQKMVRDLESFKIIILKEYPFFLQFVQKYFENQHIEKSQFIHTQNFLKELAKLTWNNFKNLINSQKKMINNMFEIKIIINCLHSILRLRPQIYDKNIVTQQILPTIVSNIRLIQASEQFSPKYRMKLMNSLDEVLLHLILVHPFTPKTCSEPVDFLVDRNNIERYLYLKYFSERQEIQNYLYPYPMQTAQTALFIEKILQGQRNLSFFRQKDNFIFHSIYNIIKDNPQRFWNQPTYYRNITQYIKFIVNNIEELSEQDYQIDCYFNPRLQELYRNVWKFAHLLGLLHFPTLEQSISSEKSARLIKNKYVFPNFIKTGIQMIVVTDPSGYNNTVSEQIDTEPIYEFLHKLIIHKPSVYFNSKDSLSQAYQGQVIQREIFGNYLMKFAENGSNAYLCIIAFTKLIQQGSNVEVHAIMNHLAEIDKNIHQISGSKQYISKLQYIVKNLIRRKENYAHLIKHVLSILKHYPKYSTHPWMERLLNEFKQLPQNIHPENISQYAKILEICLIFIKNSPKSATTLQQFLRFKCANEYLSRILEISYQNEGVFNKYVRANIYDQIYIAVRLLKAMTSLYLKQKTMNEGQIVPYEIRKALQSQNKDGDYQITMRNSALSYHAISYHLGLITILLSKEFAFDIDVKSFPNFQNEIFQTLINLNSICLQTKNELNLKISVIYNKQLQVEINKKLNLKLQLLDSIFRTPSYLGYQYLITSGSLQLKQKKLMLERVKQLREQRSFSSLKNMSHFIVMYWKQIQNSKMKIEVSVSYDYIKREVQNIAYFLQQFQHIQNLTQQERQNANEIMQNLYTLLDLLKKSSKESYAKFVIKFHNILFDFRYNNINSLESQGKSNYQNTILVFFTAKSYLSNEQFTQLVKQTEMHIHLFEFLRDLLKLTYKRNYNVMNDVANLEIMQFGVAFMIELGAPQLHIWLKQIKKLLVDRPQKSSPMLTRQIIILILIKSKLGQKIQQQLVEFGNKDWLLMMNSVEPNVRHSSILISQLFTIYDMHYIYFTSACHYLCQTAKTKYLEQLYQVNNYKIVINTVNVLMDLLKKSIESQKSYYCIWIVQIFIEIIMNKQVSKNVREKFGKAIRVGILLNISIHERISQIFSKIGSVYSKNYINLWKSTASISNNPSKLKFQQKQQLLAYLRLLTFISFMDQNEKHNLQLKQSVKNDCAKVEKDMLFSFLELLPLVGCLLKDESERQAIVASSQWQRKLKSFDLAKIPEDTKTMNSSGIKQLSSEKLSEVCKSRNGLFILHEVSNIQLASITTMWLSRLKNQPKSQLNKIFFKNAEANQSYFNNFLKFLQSLKKNLVFFKEGKSQIKYVLQFLRGKIYLGSVQVSKQLMYTNMASLSSSLAIHYDQLKYRLSQSFDFIFCIVKHIFDVSNDKVKSQQKFSKIFNRFLRSCNQIKQDLQGPGSNVQIPDYESNRSQMTYNTKSFSKSRTLWNHH